MRILLVAPLSKDTILGVIGSCCRDALIKLGQEMDTFDFRASQYFKNPAGSLVKKAIRRICNIPRQRFPLLCSLEQEKMNRALVSKVKEFRPNLVLVLMGDTILPATLEEIKGKGAILANWFHDTVLDPDRQDLIRKISPCYDYFFVYDSKEVLQCISIGSRYVESVPLACNPDVHKTVSLTPGEKKRYGSQVCFVGSMKYKREELLKSLTDFDLAIWGNWEKKNPALAEFYREKNVFDEVLTKIYNASDIALDIHIFYGSNQKAFDINPRVYESTACGTFTMTNESQYLGELYEIGKEIVCYKDEADLRQKLIFYLKYPELRKEIALKGQARARQEHTYENRLKKIISIVERKGE